MRKAMIALNSMDCLFFWRVFMYVSCRAHTQNAPWWTIHPLDPIPYCSLSALHFGVSSLHLICM